MCKYFFLKDEGKSIYIFMCKLRFIEGICYYILIQDNIHILIKTSMKLVIDLLFSRE